MLLGDIIKDYRGKHNNMSQRDFAEKCNLSHTYIAALEKNIDGRSGKPIAPTLDAVKSIAKAMNMDLQLFLALLNDKQEFKIKNTKNNNITIKIPLVGKVAAGEPILAQENLEFDDAGNLITIDLPIEFFKGINPVHGNLNELFALQVKGDSMFPRFVNNDYIIVKPQNTIENGKVAVILIGNEEVTVKEVNIMDNGIMLIPWNRKYQPTFFTKNEIINKPVIIIGRVVRMIGNIDGKLLY